MIGELCAGGQVLLALHVMFRAKFCCWIMRPNGRGKSRVRYRTFALPARLIALVGFTPVLGGTLL